MKWDYTVKTGKDFSFPHDKSFAECLGNELTKLGHNEWELVGQMTTDADECFIFKRPAKGKGGKGRMVALD
jgi:hypothetical protein